MTRAMTKIAAGCIAMALLASAPAGARAQETRPYDDRLLRLAEILGTVHYLRELCGAREGQLWRERMRELMDAEGSSALRMGKSKHSRRWPRSCRHRGRAFRLRLASVFSGG